MVVLVPARRRLAGAARHLGAFSAAGSVEPVPPAALPAEWRDAEWLASVRRHDKPLLDMDRVAASFDYDKFLRDGAAVLPAVLPAPVCAAWAAAIRDVQLQNDAFVVADWTSLRFPGADSGGLQRLPPSAVVLPRVAREAAVGRSQTLSRAARNDAERSTVALLRKHCVVPEYFPCYNSAFLMDALYHPQMLQLQNLLFGGAPFWFDHAQILTREPGYLGHPWHSHPNGEASSDGVGVCSDPREYEQQRNLIYLFVYPDGFEGTGDDGGLKIVEGSHLFRDPAINRLKPGRGGTPGLEVDDDEFTRRWIAGKNHPMTGQPLCVTRLSLPPGSIVAAFAHLAHGISPRSLAMPPRGASLWCYQRASERAGWDPSASGGANIPPALQGAAQRGELPSTLAQLVADVVNTF